MRFWVVSPNVRNEGSGAWIDAIRKNHCVYMGYGPGETHATRGRDFHHTVKRGDIVLIAQGANWQKELYFAGIVDSDVKAVTPEKDGVPDHAYARELKGMVGEGVLNGLKLNFDVTASGGASKNPGSIYELHPSENPKDQEIALKLKTVLEKTVKMEKMGTLSTLLENNYNLILTGAPGTGKTYLARQLAQKLIFGDYWEPKDENNFEESEREKFENQFGFVQFHPSYDYTDFVEGLRPTKPDANGNIGFERTDGIFKEFCKRVLQNPTNDFDQAWSAFINVHKDRPLLLKTPRQQKSFKAWVNTNNSFSCQSESAASDEVQSVTNENVRACLNGGEPNWSSYTPPLADYFKTAFLCPKFVFVIDEINRGELSKIFGELFFSMDPGYRGVKGKVKTQYANLIEEDDAFKDGFYVPENVYIIGTMNDIDRSVESFDFAMRRRFVWEEITAAESAENMGLDSEVWDKMKALNEAIAKVDGLNSSYHIGGAYFLKLKKYDGDFNALWQYHIKPLLREYLRGMPDAEAKLRELRKAYDGAHS